MEKKFYVYVHKVPNTDVVFYVGSNWQGGNTNRAFEIIKRPKKWLKEVSKHNGKYDIEILSYFDNGKEAYNHEMKLMAKYQDEHNWCWCNGERRNDEWKAKIRSSVTCRKIIAIKNNEQTVFDSVRYASELLQIPRPTIHYYLKSGTTHPSGYYFKNY